VSQAILVVDDEPGILEIAGAYLRKEGFAVRTAATGQRALDAVATQRPDLIVLDLKLPDIPGEEVCARLRAVSDVPILMLTAKSAEEDRVRGLAIGADDYLVKPFSPRELVARVRAILRRVHPGQGPAADLLSLDGGGLEVDLARYEVRIEALPVVLTASEFRLLATLCRQPGRVFSRFELLEAMHGQDVEGFERTVDAHVKNLRRKLDDVSPGAGGYVATVYGVGYRLSEGR
jgi:DNA-binding response OmpR family regulator